MNLGYGLVQEQRLKQILTPKLYQALTLLQYPLQELMTLLEKQAEQNPLVEIEHPSHHDIETELIEPMIPFPDDDEHYDSIDFNQYTDPLDNYAMREVTLQQHILDQLKYFKLSIDERRILVYMVGNLDENGYLDPEAENAVDEGLCSPAMWEKCLGILHQLEPHGVGARNLAECLLIQLDHSMYRDDGLCRELIRHHLDDIAYKRYDRLAKHFDTDEAKIKERVEIIQSFHPKPGSLFVSQTPRYIIPDVFVERLPDGTFVLEANDRALPRVGLNREYASLLKEGGPAQPYLQQKVKEYVWLVRSLRKRKETILKVAEVIVRKQVAFFESGPHDLAPLTLKDVALELGLHESTVSRAVNQKYMQTSWGVYELKYFFRQGLAAVGGGKVSEAKIKHMIKQLINQEDRRKPLSDQQLVHRLAEEGIQIARRTVAKYRDELGIPSSKLRKNR